MGWIDDLIEAWKSGLTTHVPEDYRQRPTDRRPLNQEDLAGFSEAMDQRKPSLEIADVQAYLKRVNPYRWARITSDMRWMRGKMVKLGLNPDEAGLYL